MIPVLKESATAEHHVSLDEDGTWHELSLFLVSHTAQAE